MRVFVCLCFAGFGTGNLINLITPRTPEPSAIGSSTTSASSSQTPSPTVTYVSYVTMSNGTILANSSSPIDDPGKAVMTQSEDLCPDCYDPKNPSKTAWKSAYEEQINPYIYGEWTDFPARSTKHPASERDFCSAIWSSSWYRYLETASWSAYFTPSISDNDIPYTINPTSTIHNYMAFIEETYIFSNTMPFTASPPCCGACSFTVGAAQVYQWPFYTQPPSISSLVNEANFTFTYPSVYIQFETIGAHDTCGNVGTGRSGATTIAFDASELSTANSYHWSATGALMNQTPLTPAYTAFNTNTSVICEDVTTTIFYFYDHGVLSQDIGPDTIIYPLIVGFDGGSNTGTLITTTQVDTGSPVIATYNPCSPWLSIPEKIRTLDPLWNTCLRDILAVYDPDIQLQPGPGFSPVTTHVPVTTRSHPGDAIAGPSISQNFAASTRSPQQPSAQPNAPSPQQPYSQPNAPQNQPSGDPNAPPNQPSAQPNPPSPPFSRIAPTISFGKTTVTMNSASEIVIGTQTVKPGDQAVFAGTTVSYASNGQYVNVGGTTQYINPAFAVGTQTLSAGGPAAVVSGKTYSVEAGGSSVVIDGTTEAVSQATQAVASMQKVWMTVPAYIIDGQTMIAGGLPVTAGNTVMSLDPSGESVLVVVSKTMDINDVLGSTDLPDAFGQVAFETNSTLDGGLQCSVTSSSVGSLSSQTTVAGGKTKSGARTRVDGSCQYLWLAMVFSIAVVIVVL